MLSYATTHATYATVYATIFNLDRIRNNNS